MSRLDLSVLAISRRSPGIWMCASSSLRKQTMLIPVPLLAYFFM